MGVFHGYVAPATRAIVAASQYNEYILQVLLCCTNGFAGFLALTLKVNGYLRSTLKRLPSGASEDLTPEGRTSSTTLLHSPTLERNGWKCYHSWRYLNHYHNRIHSASHTIPGLFSHPLAVCCVVVSHVSLAPRVVLKVCVCVRAAVLFCMAVTRRLGPLVSTLWIFTGCGPPTRTRI